MRALNFKQLITAVTAVTILGGCAGTNLQIPTISMTKEKKQVEETIPAWYENPMQNNEMYIYGVGQGDSMEDAKTNALNSMASRLIVSIGSSLETTTSTSTNGDSQTYSKDVTKSVKVDVEKIKFTNAVMDKSKKVGYDYYVQMSVDRVELFKNLKKEFSILDTRISKRYKKVKKIAKLEKIQVLKELYPLLVDGKKRVIILNAINNKFDQAKYINRYDSYIDKIYQVRDDSSITVVSNHHKKYFKDAVIDLLNNERFKVSKRKNADIRIKINNKIKYNKVKRWNIAKVTSTISVISNKKIVSNRIIRSTGRSTISRDGALEDASKKFVNKIKAETIDKVVFNM